MKSRRQTDMMMSFLAGLGLGAVLGRRFGFPGGVEAGEAFPSRPVAAGLTAASVRRINSLLGEIRGLVAARKEGKGLHGAGKAAGEAGPAMREEGAAVAGTAPAGGEGVAGKAAPESAAARVPEALDAAATGPFNPPRETWRIPDQIGYGMRAPGRMQARAVGGAALVACAAAAASTWGARRRGRLGAAWPAIPGLLAAALLWRRNGKGTASRALGDRIHRLQGRISPRRGRPAVP